MDKPTPLKPTKKGASTLLDRQPVDEQVGMSSRPENAVNAIDRERWWKMVGNW